MSESKNREQRLLTAAIREIEVDKVDINIPYGMPLYLAVPLDKFTKEQLIQIIVQRGLYPESVTYKGVPFVYGNDLDNPSIS